MHLAYSLRRVWGNACLCNLQIACNPFMGCNAWKSKGYTLNQIEPTNTDSTYERRHCIPCHPPSAWWYILQVQLQPQLLWRRRLVGHCPLPNLWQPSSHALPSQDVPAGSLESARRMRPRHYLKTLWDHFIGLVGKSKQQRFVKEARGGHTIISFALIGGLWLYRLNMARKCESTISNISWDTCHELPCGKGLKRLE